MTKPTNTPSSTSNAATPTSGGLPLRPAGNASATTTANASNSRSTEPRAQPATPNNGGPGPRPLPPTPQPGTGPRPLPQTPQPGTGPRPLPQTPQPGTQNSNIPGPKPQPGQAAQPHTTDNNGSLRVFRDHKVLTQFHPFPVIKDFLQVSPSDPLFLAVSYCIDTALRVLELPIGRHGLIEGGKLFVKGIRSKSGEVAFKGDPDNANQMGEWVNYFLDRVREDFPNVCVSATLRQNAELIRMNRPPNAEKDFKPKLAGIMCLDKRILDNLLYQAKVIVTTKDSAMKEAAEKNFQCSLFYMSVIILHEIMHLSIWYTSNDTRPGTPRDMALYDAGKRSKGESGEFLEVQVFGGYLKFRQDTKDPLKGKQTGLPFSQTATGPGQEDVRMVDLQFMANVLDPRAKPDFTKVFTPDSVSRPFNLRAINKDYPSMSRIKEAEDRKTYEILEKHAPGEANFQPVILPGDMQYLATKPAFDLKRNATPLDPKVLVKAGN